MRSAIEPADTSPATANGSRDVVFTFFMESWKNAAGRERYMSGPRLMATLMSEPSVRRLLVANPYRSTPIQWVRRLVGEGPPPFPADKGRALVEPRRIRRFDPTAVRALERVLLTIEPWRPQQQNSVLIGRRSSPPIRLLQASRHCAGPGGSPSTHGTTFGQETRSGNGGRRTMWPSAGFGRHNAP